MTSAPLALDWRRSWEGEWPHRNSPPSPKHPQTDAHGQRSPRAPPVLRAMYLARLETLDHIVHGSWATLGHAGHGGLRGAFPYPPYFFSPFVDPRLKEDIVHI